MPAKIRVPAHFANDRQCLEWVAATAGVVNGAGPAFGWIRDTLQLGRIALSANLRPRVESTTGG